MTDVQIGWDQKLASEFYQPLNAARTWFVAPSLRVEGKDLPIYANNTQIADFRDRQAEADFDVGTNLGNWGEIRVGYHRLNGATHDNWGNPALAQSQYNNGELFFKFSYDRLDNVHFPREGQTFTLQWDANRTNLGGDFPFDKVQADLADGAFARPQHHRALDFGGHHAERHHRSHGIAGLLCVGRIFQFIRSCAPIPARPELRHHPRHLFPQDQPRRRRAYSKSRSIWARRWRLGNTWQQRGDMSFGSARKDASVFFAFDTYFGPLYLGSGYDTARQRRVLVVPRPHLLRSRR